MVISFFVVKIMERRTVPRYLSWEGGMENTISLFALNEAKKCSKGYALSKLHLNYHGGAASPRGVIQKALAVVKEGIVTGRKKDEVLFDVKEVLLEYPVKEDDLLVASEKRRETVFGRIAAMTDYLYLLPGEKEKDVCFSFEVGEYRFKDKADIVITEGENVRAIIFDHGESIYTTRAGKPEKLPTKCVGVNMLAAAGYENAEVWYLKSKDEKNDVVPPFEVKRGKNIVGASIPVGVAKAYLLSVITNTECGDCQMCRHKPVCKLREVRIDKEGASGANKNPQFTEEQRKAVDHREGPMALIAVPGAGKTTVLVHRLLAMHKEGIPADKILFITFTKKAAGEIRERIEALLPDDEAVPSIYTFNAFGYTLLKENPTLIGKRVKIADENDCKGMIRSILNEAAKNGRELKGISYSGAFLEYGLVGRLLTWFESISVHGKEEFIKRYGEKVPDLDGVLSFYDDYDKLFQQNGFITFDEQISLVNEIFLKYPSVAEKVAMQYSYIMVDEFQDTAKAQADMIYAIAKHHDNIVVVGDDDQSIYGWRGGSNEYLLNFKDAFPKAEIVIMNDNFRSNNKILIAADSVIGENKNRYEKELKGHKEASNPPLFFKDAEKGTLRDVVGKLLRQYKPGEIAILARKNKRFDDVEEELSGLVKLSSPKDYLIEDAIFEMLYDVLTLYYNINDDVALYRCLTRLGITEFPQKKSSQVPLYEAIRESEPLFNLDRLDIHAMDGYKGELSGLLLAGKTLLSMLKKMQYYKSMEEAFHAVAEGFLLPPDHKVLQNLLETCDEHAFVRISDLYAYMRDMVLFKSTKRVGYGVAEDAISLLTGHDSKGQEFPVVIIYDVEDFTGGTEEDNSLLYVAMTRAKNTLVMIESEYPERSALTIGNMKEYVNVR